MDKYELHAEISSDPHSLERYQVRSNKRKTFLGMIQRLEGQDGWNAYSYAAEKTQRFPEQEAACDWLEAENERWLAERGH